MMQDPQQSSTSSTPIQGGQASTLSQEEQQALRKLCELPEQRPGVPHGATAFPDLSKIPLDKIGAVLKFVGELLLAAKG